MDEAIKHALSSGDGQILGEVLTFETTDAIGDLFKTLILTAREAKAFVSVSVTIDGRNDEDRAVDDK